MIYKIPSNSNSCQLIIPNRNSIKINNREDNNSTIISTFNLLLIIHYLFSNYTFKQFQLISRIT